MLNPSKTNQELIEENSLLKQRLRELEQSLLMRKITDERASQEKDSNDQSIPTSPTEGIFHMSVDGRLLVANSALAHLLGYESIEVLFASVTNIGKLLFVAQETYSEYIRLVFEKKTVKAFETKVYRKDGSILWLSINSRLISDDLGNPIYIDGFVSDITENRKLRDELHAVMREQRIILDTANVGISLIRDRKQVWINQKTEEMFQYSKEELINQTTRKLYPSQEAYEQLGAAAYPILAQGMTYETVQELVRRDGSHIWVRYNGRAIDPHDLSQGTLWILEDITERKGIEEKLQRAYDELELRVADRTEALMLVNEELRTEIAERKQAEEALRESEERYRLLVETANEGIWSMDGDHATTFVNQAMANMLGYEPSEMLGKKVEEFFFPEDMSFHEKRMTIRHRGDDEVYERRFRRRDGKSLWTMVSAKALKDGTGRFIGSFAMFTDITERKLAEESLREQEQIFRLITETIDEVFWMADVDIGRMFYISPSYERVWGRSRESLYKNPQSFLDAVHVEDREHVIVGLTIEKSGQPFAHEYRIVLPDGSVRHIWDRGFPVHDEKGQLYSYAGIAIDITEQRRSEASLKLRLQLLEFSAEHSVEDLLQKALDEIGALTDSPIGFYHFVEADEKTLSLQAWSTRTEREFCLAAGRGLHYGIEQAGVWVDSIRERKPVIHNDYAALPHRKGLPPGHAAVIRELTMPIFRGGKIVAILGIGNKPTDYTEADLRMVSFLADVTWEIVRKKMAEKELRESEIKFRLIFDTTLEGIYQSTPEGRYIIVNPAFAYMLGYESPKDLMETVDNIGQQLYVDPHRRSEIKSLLATRGSVEGFEAQLYRKDRSTIWVIINAMAVKDENGDILYYQGGMVDITERKRVEEELKSANIKLESLWNVSSLSGANTKIISDHVLESITRMTQSEYGFYGFINDDESVMIIHSWSGEAMKDCSMVSKPQHFPIDEAGVWAEAIRRREPFILNDYADTDMAKKRLPEGHVELTNLMVVPHFTQDRITSVAAVANRHADYSISDVNQITAFLNSVQSIVDSKQAEEAVRESQQRLTDIIEFLPDATLVINKDGKVIAWNRAIESMTGVRAEAMLGKDNYEYALPFYGERKPILIDIALHPDLKKENSYTAIQTMGDVVFGEAYTPILASGRVHLSGTASVLRNSTGEIVGAIECIRNNTDRKNMEERLQRAEKMEALGLLAGGVAHDLNNALGILVGYSELLYDGLAETDPLREDARNIMRGGEQAAAIVQDLLTLARRGVQTKTIININKTVNEYLKSPEYLKLTSFHPTVRIKTELEGEILKIAASPVHLSKTLNNLISNAAEAMPSGGDIVIHTENRYMDRPVSGYDTVLEGDYVVLSVTDEGEGITDDDMKRIFEPFYTKKVMGRSGTGLGLAVVWGTVKDHNGYIDVQSRRGEGTTFILYFPVSHEEILEDKVTLLDEYMGHGEKILVVDDIKDQRDLATRILSKLDYQVEVVTSGEEAVGYLKLKEADLIVLDMIMEPGIDGLETYRQISKIRPNQKAIIVSGYAETERVKMTQSLGAGAFVKKPYVRERLGMAVRKELDRK